MSQGDRERVESRVIPRGSKTGNEAHFPAEQPQAAQDPWVPRQDADDRWPQRLKATAGQGPQAIGSLGINGPSKARFEAIFSSGWRVSGQFCRLVALPGTGMAGFATSKKIGSNPRRNRIKRRFRETLRSTDLVRPGFDYVIVILPSAEGATQDQIKEDVTRVFGRMAERWANESASS